MTKLYRHTIICPPGTESAVAAACPDGVAVRTNRLLPDDQRLYVIDNDAVDDMLHKPYLFTWEPT